MTLSKRLEFGGQGLTDRFWILGFRAYELGFRIEAVGFRVTYLGFMVRAQLSPS